MTYHFDHLQRETGKFKGAIKNIPQAHRAAIQYTKAMEQYIAAIELENAHLNHVISNLIHDEKTLLHIMASYGISLKYVGSLSKYAIQSQIDFSRRGIFRTPEKLTKKKPVLFRQTIHGPISKQTVMV